MLEPLRANPLNPDPLVIEKAIFLLRQGLIGVIPTETVYGIACPVLSATAAKRLSALKGRSFAQPLQVLAGSLEDVERSGALLDSRERVLANRFWPGPLTLVLKHSRGGTVGFRVPAHHIARTLAAHFPEGLYATSANLHGEKDPATLDDVPASIVEAAAFAIDAGPCLSGKASTVIEMSGSPPRFLRIGSISKEEIMITLADVK